MLKREFKVNLKSFIIWTSVLIIMFIFVFSIYPFIVVDDNIKNFDEMMKVFPPEMLKAFNMDITSMNTVYGWLKSEGFMFVLLVVGFYSSFMGFNILLKEEDEKTIEYLESLPVKRCNIVTNKIIVGITYIILMVLTLSVFNYICLCLSGDFNHKQYLLLSITPIFIGLPFFAISLFISTFLRKTKKTMGISLGLVFIFYILNILSELAKDVEILKYFSIYTLADIRHVITKVSISPLCVIISILVTVLFIGGTYIKYNKKELV